MIYDKKLICLDLSFNNTKFNTIDDLALMQKLIKKISGDQHLVILTNETIKSVNLYLKSWNIRSGILIANGGASIVNIGSQKKMYEIKMANDDARMLVHAATLEDLCIIVNTRDDKTFSYKINDWLFDQLNNSEYGWCNIKPDAFFENWNLFSQEIANNAIISVEILFWDNKKNLIEKQMNDFLKKIEFLNDSLNIFVSKCTIFFTAKNASRLNALAKVNSVLKTNFKKDTLYIGIDNFDKKLLPYAYISVANSLVFCQDDNVNWKSRKKDHFISKSTIFLSNNTNAWINWLEDNDYLWAYKPKTNIEKFFSKNILPQSDKEEIEGILQSDTKILFLNEENKLYDENKLAKNQTTPIYYSSKTKNLFNKVAGTEKLKNYGNNIQQIPLWEENKTEIISKILPEITEEISANKNKK